MSAWPKSEIVLQTPDHVSARSYPVSHSRGDFPRGEAARVLGSECRPWGDPASKAGGLAVPRYKFRWSNLPSWLLDSLCAELLDNYEDLDPAEALQSVYRVRPTDEFVREAWPVLRDTWLWRERVPRNDVVDALRRSRGEDGCISSRRAQIEYLRKLRGAKSLRDIVLRAFIAYGEDTHPGSGLRTQADTAAKKAHLPHGEPVTTSAATGVTEPQPDVRIDQQSQPVTAVPEVGQVVTVRGAQLGGYGRPATEPAAQCARRCSPAAAECGDAPVRRRRPPGRRATRRLGA